MGDVSYSGTLSQSTKVVLPYITKRSCTITYDGNGATVTPIETQSGYAEIPLTLPTCNSDPIVETDFYKLYLIWCHCRDDSTALGTTKGQISRADFLGWYTAVEGGDRVGGSGDSYTPTGDITLYAHWSEMAAVTLPTPTKEGYTFTGWYTAETGGERVGGAGDLYTPSENTVSLYAHWGCTVSFNGNGATSDGKASAFVNEGESTVLPSNFSKSYLVQFNDRSAINNITSDAELLGWYTAASDGTKIGDAGGSYIPTGDITLYAHWSEMPPVTMPSPKQYGYTFIGWWDASSDFNATIKYGDGGDSFVPTERTTVCYSRWEPINLIYVGNNRAKSFYLGQTPIKYIFKGTTMVYYNPNA